MDNSNDKKLNKRKVIKLSIVLILIISILTLIVLYNRNSSVRFFMDKYVFQKYITGDSLPYIDLDSENNNSFYLYDDKLVILSQNILKVYNKSGNELYSFEIQINTPLFASNGDYLCIAEKNGNKIYTICNKNIVWQKDMDGTISNISINKNGFTAVTICSGSYQSIVFAFNNDGNELFKSYHAKNYVISTSFSNDNKYLAIAHANFSGTLIESNIKIISVENARLSSENAVLSECTANINDLIIDIKYSSDNSLMCMFDSYIGIFENNSVRTICNFSNENIIFSSLNNSIVTVVRNSDGLLTSSFDIKITDSSNGSFKTYNITEEPRTLHTYNNVVALNLGTDAIFINNNGNLIKKYTSTHEIKNILVYDNLACIIYKNKVEFLSL